MAQIRKLQGGGQPVVSPNQDSPQKPQTFKVGDTEYGMDTYVSQLSKNLENWLDKTDFTEQQKREQRKLLPIFIEKLRAGIITPVEGGGWRDATLEMRNEEKDGYDKWGALAWFATKGLNSQDPYDETASKNSRDIPEYDPESGLSSLKKHIFGSSLTAFVNLDSPRSDDNTKRSLSERSKQLQSALGDFAANPDKFMKFKYKDDKDNVLKDVQHILEPIEKNGVIDSSAIFYLSRLGLGDTSQYFSTDISKSSKPQDDSSHGDYTQGSYVGNQGQYGGGQYGNGQYGDTASAESVALWLNNNPQYKVKYTNTAPLSFSTIRTIETNTANTLASYIQSMPEKDVTNAIYGYFYDRNNAKNIGHTGLTALFYKKDRNAARFLADYHTTYPEVVDLMLTTMIKNNSRQLENIANGQYILKGSYNKYFNTVLLYDSINRTLKEVSAFQSPTFRNKVLLKYAQDTGIQNIPSNLDWYTQFYKEGGVLKAQAGVQLNFWDLKNKYLNFTDDVTGNDGEQLEWVESLGKWTPMSQSALDAGLKPTGITKKQLEDTFNWNNFNTSRNNSTNKYKYITFDTNKGNFSYTNSNVDSNGQLLKNTWGINDIVNKSPAKGTLGWNINKHKDDYSYDSSFSGDESYNGDFNDQASFERWLAETNKLDSGYKGIYYSKKDNKWYRTKTAPTYGKLITPDIVVGWKPKNKDNLSNLKQGPSNFEKFMQYWGSVSGDVLAGIAFHQSNNKGAEKLVNAINGNYKSLPIEQAKPLLQDPNLNLRLQKGVNIQSQANDTAELYTDSSLGAAVRRQGTLDKIANDTQAQTAANQYLQPQIQKNTADIDKNNQLKAKTADDNLAESNRVTLAKTTAEVEKDKNNMEKVWGPIWSKISSMTGTALSDIVNRKQSIADYTNKVSAKAWYDQAYLDKKKEWLTANPGKTDYDFMKSPEYKDIRNKFELMVILGKDYVPFGTNENWDFPWTKKNGGVLSLKTQSLLNKVIK